ncbi:hypothetical protein ACWV95_31280 [Streptomyces albus]
MNDFSGVDPYRLRDLANALQGLADTLDREGKTIRDLFTKWEGTLGQGVLTQQAAQVRDDARSMALRADFAYNVLLQPRIGPVNSPLPPNWVNIPWDVSRIDTAQEGAQEARSLLAALNNPDSPQSRTTLRMLSQSLADHANDPAFLQAFMNAGGLEASARAARFLHTQDGTHGEAVLSQESEQILARFGQAVQAATSLAEQGKIKLSPTYLEALTKPKGGDMWSVAMLFKYGPKGDKWDAKVLSSVGGAMLDWRSKQQMRPDYSPPSMNIGGYVPGGYVEGDNPWYESLGLNVSYLSVGSGDAAVRIRGIAANDPSLILMQRVGENADASRQLLLTVRTALATPRRSSTTNGTLRARSRSTTPSGRRPSSSRQRRTARGIRSSRRRRLPTSSTPVPRSTARRRARTSTRRRNIRCPPASRAHSHRFSPRTCRTSPSRTACPRTRPQPPRRGRTTPAGSSWGTRRH